MTRIDSCKPYELPRCIETDAHGRRCRKPVVWDHFNNRPISTRCQDHGGLMDAALLSWPRLDAAEASDPR